MPRKLGKARADFSYEFFNVGQSKILAIEDLNLGNTTVTNDIKNVIDDITDREPIDPTEYLVVYKDSEGTWDGWSWVTNWYLYLGGKTAEEAARKFSSLMDMTPIPRKTKNSNPDDND